MLGSVNLHVISRSAAKSHDQSEKNLPFFFFIEADSELQITQGIKKKAYANQKS